MTKVKTILAEFCSAKDILAINRLGLLSKGDERESQPIPWRHRLRRGERQELVRSEMRMSIRPKSRQSTRDKTKAVDAARSPQHSRMGEYLVQAHARDSSLGGQLGRLSREKRRAVNELQLSRRSFLRQSRCLNWDPMILVERPASPNVRTRAAFMARHGADPMVATLPGYMRPLKSRSRTPSTLTTIEAFTVETKKKRNVWEEAMDEKEAAKFKATSKPSARLTDHELRQLRIGHSLHKPTPESVSSAPVTPVSRTKPSRPPPRPTTASTSRTSSPVFLTELSASDFQKMSEPKVTKSVTFAETTSVRVAGGRKKGKAPIEPKAPLIPTATIFVHQDNNTTVGTDKRNPVAGNGGIGDNRKREGDKGSHESRIPCRGTSSPGTSRRDDGKKLQEFFSVLLKH